MPTKFATHLLGISLYVIKPPSDISLACHGCWDFLKFRFFNLSRIHGFWSSLKNIFLLLFIWSPLYNSLKACSTVNNITPHLRVLILDAFRGLVFLLIPPTSPTTAHIPSEGISQKENFQRTYLEVFPSQLDR